MFRPAGQEFMPSTACQDQREADDPWGSLVAGGLHLARSLDSCRSRLGTFTSLASPTSCMARMRM